MTCSAVSGTGYRWPSTRLHQSCQLLRSGLLTPRLGDCLPPLNAVALGVGHNPHSVPKLSGTSVGSWYAMPFSIIPDRGQASENTAKAPSKQSCDVLHDDDSRSNVANEAVVVEPQPASCAVKTFATACETNVLAGKSSNDCSRAYPVCSKSITGKFANIVIDRDTREACAQSRLRLAVELAQCDRFETASALKPKVDAPDASEQRKDFVRFHLTPQTRPIAMTGAIAGRRGRGQRGNGEVHAPNLASGRPIASSIRTGPPAMASSNTPIAECPVAHAKLSRLVRCGFSSGCEADW